MASPTTLRGELLRERRTFNDRFFLTLGESTAGMSPYNPIQLGLGVTLRVQTNNHVNNVRMTLKRVTDGDDEPAGVVTVAKFSDTEWRAEGAIGGARLGFPQPAPDYHIPHCFELKLIIRNRGRTVERTYNFWVGEGPVGTIVSCHTREMIGARPIVCCFDGLSFRDPIYPWAGDPAAEFAQFFALNGDPAMACLEDDGEGLPPIPDPPFGVYVPGLPDPINFIPAVDNPWARGDEASPNPFDFPYQPGSPEYTVDGVDQTGLIPAGSTFDFDFPQVASGLTYPVTLFNDKGWGFSPREPYTDPSTTWLVSPEIDLRYYSNASMEFYLWEDLTSQGGVKLQYTQDEGASWTDIPPGDISVPTTGPQGGALSAFGGADDKLDVQAQTLTRITVDLSQFDGQQVRIRWCGGIGVGVIGTPAGPFVSGVKFFADAGPILQMEADMDRLRDGHGDQWKIPRPDEDEKWWHGARELAPRASAAAPPPSGGTGIANNLIANPQVGNDIGGVPGGPNIGFPAGLDPQAGVSIELAGANLDEIVTVAGASAVRISLADWLPLGQYDIVLLMGDEATWVGGANPGGQVQLGGAQPAHLLCAVRQAVAYYDVPSGPGPWPAANTLGGLHLALNPGQSAIYNFTLQGIWPVGTVLACHAIITDLASAVGGGAGYFTNLFPNLDTLRSNALRFVIIP